MACVLCRGRTNFSSRSLALRWARLRVRRRHIFGIAGAVGFAEGVAAGDERNGFFIVHRHARESFADVARGAQRIGLAVGAFGIDVDEAHLHGGERIVEFAIATIAFVGEPVAFGSPEDIFLRLPDVFAAAGKTKSFEAHGFECDVAGENHEIGPGKFAAVFLFDGPEEAARFVEVGVVGPAVEGSETLRAVAGAPASIGDAIGASAVPSHANEERTVVAEVGGPPALRVGHQRMEIFDDGVEIERFEFFRVVEALVHGIGERGILVKDFEIELIGPPRGIRRAARNGMFARTAGCGSGDRALCFGGIAGVCGCGSSEIGGHVCCSFDL